MSEAKPNPYHDAEDLDACDLEALQEAIEAAKAPQTVLNTVRAMLSKRYRLGPMDSIDLASGKINRVKPDPAPETPAATQE